MQFLVEMKLARAARSKSPQDGLQFIERYVLPTLTTLEKHQSDGKLLAGGPVSGSIELALIFEATSIQELDDLIEDLPLWPLMETQVRPLTTFAGRTQSISPLARRLRSIVQSPPA